MIQIAKIGLEFTISFLLVYFGLYLFSFRQVKRYNRKKLPVNVKYLTLKYNIDIVKIGYKKVLSTLMLSDSFIVAFLFVVTRIIDNIYVRLLVAFILVFPLFAGIYHLVAKYLIKESE